MKVSKHIELERLSELQEQLLAREHRKEAQRRKQRGAASGGAAGEEAPDSIPGNSKHAGLLTFALIRLC